MAGPTYIKFYPLEWFVATRKLKPLEYYAYHRILLEMWMEGIPKLSEAEIIDTLSLTEEEWKSVRSAITKYFKLIGQNLIWYHDRVDGDLAESFDGIAKKSKAGQASALARRAKKRAEERKLNAGKKPSITDGYSGNSTPVETPVSTGEPTTRQENTELDNSKQDNTSSASREGVLLHANWLPSKHIIRRLSTELRIPAPFPLNHIEGFRDHWIEKGEKRPTDYWNGLFFEWVKRKWEIENGSEQDPA